MTHSDRAERWTADRGVLTYGADDDTEMVTLTLEDYQRLLDAYNALFDASGALRNLVNDVERDWCLVCGRDTEGSEHELGHDPDCSWNVARSHINGSADSRRGAEDRALCEFAVRGFLEFVTFGQHQDGSPYVVAVADDIPEFYDAVLALRAALRPVEEAPKQ